MEKDFRDAVNNTMSKVLGMDIYQEPLKDLEQRVQEGKRNNVLNNGLEKNPNQQAEEKNVGAGQNSEKAKKEEVEER